MRRFIIETDNGAVEATDFASAIERVLPFLQCTVTAEEPLTTQAENVLKSAGKPELGTMAVCVKCGQEVVFKVDFDDGPLSVNTLAWWALVDPDGDEDPFLCRPRGGGALTMHSADPGVEQS
jgi:hypothetical protein